MSLLQVFQTGDFFPRYEPKSRYSVVIIGAGVHGLATAYYLSRLGVTDIAVLDRGYVGGGASARTTAILRANYVTAEAIPFFRESLKLYEDLSVELDLTLLFDQTGRLDLGHSESAVFGLQTRADFNRLLGVDSRIVGPADAHLRHSTGRGRQVAREWQQRLSSKRPFRTEAFLNVIR